VSKYHAIRSRVAAAATEVGETDYRGQHQPPTREDAAAGGSSPLHDLSGTYPDDIYGTEGVRLYGAGEPGDGEAVAIMRTVRGKPNARVKVYRAVPKVMGRQEKMRDIERRKKEVLRRGRIPSDVTGFANSSQYYEHLCDELDGLAVMPDEDAAPKMEIEPGNWVTISRAYAKAHGESALNGEYRILSKTVRAGELFTDGNSLVEQGYDPF
jgi:hypothetical protein